MRLTKEQIKNALSNYAPLNAMPDKDILVNVLSDLEVIEVRLEQCDTLHIKTYKTLRLHHALHIINSLSVNEIIPRTGFRYKLWWD